MVKPGTKKTQPVNKPTRSPAAAASKPNKTNKTKSKPKPKPKTVPTRKGTADPESTTQPSAHISQRVPTKGCEVLHSMVTDWISPITPPPLPCSGERPKPLKGMSIAISGKLKKEKAFVESDIVYNGGVFKTSVSKNLTVLLTTPEEVAAETPKVVKAQGLGLPLVNETWLWDQHEKREEGTLPFDAYIL
eukprot:gene18350-827_t